MLNESGRIVYLINASSQFAQQHASLMKSLRDLRHSNQHFGQFWDQVDLQLATVKASAVRPSSLVLLKSSAYGLDLRLESLLIEPVQRLVRYKLLIEAVVEHTPPDHPDGGDVGLAQVLNVGQV